MTCIVIWSKLRTSLILHNNSSKAYSTILSKLKCSFVLSQQRYCSPVKKISVSSSCRSNNYHLIHQRSLSTLPLPTLNTTPQPTTTTTPPYKPGSISTIHKYLHKNEENKNADAYLRSAIGYQNTFFDPAAAAAAGQSKNNSVHPILQDFIAASLDSKCNAETVTSPSNMGLVNRVLSNISALNDSELLQVLHHLRYFSPCERFDSPEFAQIWSALDEECLSRSSAWNLDFLFQAADVWAGLKLVRFSKFHKNLMLHCLKNCGRFKKEHFIRWMYCLNFVRSLPNRMAKHDIEEYLRNTVRSLNIQEISVVAMACFKTETIIEDSKLLEEIVNVVISERETIDPISLAGIAKFVRYCSNWRMKPLLFRFQEAFLPELDRLGIQACTHLALTGTKSQSAYLPLVNAVVKIVEANIEDARLKDLERISLVMTMFDTDCDQLGQLIIKELMSPSSPARAEEIKEYGRCLPAILHYLSVRQIFSHDLMNRVLGMEFREAYFKNIPEIYLRELLCLDFCAELELEGYSGARLGEDVRNQISKSHVTRLSQQFIAGSKISAYEISLRKVTDIFKSFIGGSDYYVVCNILPQHFCKKIVFCTDAKTGKPVIIPTNYRSLPEHQIKYINDCQNSKDIRYHVMFTCNRNDYTFSDRKLTPSGRMNVRQLTKMGYNVHVVFPPFTASSVNHMLQNL